MHADVGRATQGFSGGLPDVGLGQVGRDRSHLPPLDPLHLVGPQFVVEPDRRQQAAVVQEGLQMAQEDPAA